MSDIQLLAVVEVDQSERVVCQAPGCGHSVYKRIHVVRENGALQVLGSECFKKLFGGSDMQAPRYGTSDGRRLTDEERQMLLQNTEILIERLKLEHEDAREAARLKLQALRQMAAARAQSTPAPAPQFQASSVPAQGRRQIGPPPEAIKKFEAQARRDVRAKYGVDADLPGWRGLVLARITELSREAEGF